MAKYFKDFTYLGKKLSELDGHYVSVDFDQNPDSAFAFSRDIDYGDTNRYRTEPNTVYARLGDKLRFELHIIKDPDTCASQSDSIFTVNDIRSITRWLTSTSCSQYLTFEYEDSAAETVPCYYGQFADIQPLNVNGDVYGLRLTFECASPYGYTEELTDTITCTGGTSEYLLLNNDDRLEDYCYPVLRMESDITGDFFFCNLSDAQILTQGTLDPASTDGISVLQTQVADYCLLHGYAPEYPLNEDGTLLTSCADTLFTCILVGADGSSKKCAAFYRSDSGQYYLIQGGFFFLNLKKALPVVLNAEKLFIFDDINRMVKFSELGVSDIDYFYWPRLVNGSNHLLLWGENCHVTLTHREARKAGA